MRSILAGTAGHVDHGKTSLVRALTGIDCDRLAEEKRRGITLDLGFAHLATGRALLGFVDVPGHEQFLANALAGLGGVRLLLFVVAADEGIRPQTREHLEIARLLAIPRLVVALTKVDAVAGAAELDLVELELGELLAATPWSGAPIVRVSATTGEGIAELAAELERSALAVGFAAKDGDPARLPLDRAFHLKGQGVIVTGTLLSGSIAAGDELELLPARTRARARSVEVHGERRAARAGERAALQLAGVALEQIGRGMELAAPGAFRTTRRLLVELELAADAPLALERPTPVRLHLHAGEALGAARPLRPERLAPGETGIAELVLRSPLVAARGDRFVVRRPSPESLLGGGRVLDPFGRRARARGFGREAGSPAGRSRDSIDRLERLRGEDGDVLLAWCEEAGVRGLAATEAAARFGRAAGELERELAALAEAGRLIPLARGGEAARYVAPEALARLRDAARERLARWLAERPLASGMPKAEAVRILLPPPARVRAELFLDFLVRLGEVELAAGEVRLPGRSGSTPAELSPLARKILDRFAAAGLTPASPAELTRDLAPKREIVEGLVKHLVARGDLVRLPSALVVAASAFETLVRELRATGWTRFSVPQFKERFALSRKWAIPLLEELDNRRVTERVGDERRVVGSSAPSPPR